MADQVAQVKDRTDIVELIGSRVELKRAGKHMKGLCPFHAEKTPSFFVSPELQVYKCFGCGESGDCFSFMQAYEGMSFREALEVLAEKAGVRLARYQSNDKEKELKRVYEILDLAREYYEFVLNRHIVGKVAREYLKKRGINQASIEKFELGWAPDSWESLSKYLAKKKGYGDDELVKSGLVVKSKSGRGVYDRFRGRVMFPLHDFRGRVVGFSGRLIEEKKDEGKYINTPETEIYRKRELLFGLSSVRGFVRKKDKIILVEGEFDVISSYQAGVVNVAAIKGSALTEEHIKLIMRLTRNVVLCLDADAAGDEAMRRGIALADRMGMNVEVIQIEGGKDPDELARTEPSKWKKLVGEAMSVYRFYIESALKRYDAQSGIGVKKIAEELAPILGRISNQVEQAYYVKYMADKLSLSEEVVRAEIERAEREGKLPKEKKEKREEVGESESREERLEKFVWGLLLSMEDQMKDGLSWLEKFEWKLSGFSKLYEKLKAYCDGGAKKFEMERFVESLPAELGRLVEEVYLDVELVGKGQEDLEKLIKTAIEELAELKQKKRMTEITQEIKRLEAKEKLDDEQERRLVDLQKEFSELLRKIKV